MVFQTFKAYKRKLDHRLGYCIVGCLITIAIVLTIFGLFHETAHEELTQYIQSTRQMIISSIPTTVSSTSTTSSATLTEVTSSNNGDQAEMLLDSSADDDDDWLDGKVKNKL